MSEPQTVSLVQDSSSSTADKNNSVVSQGNVAATEVETSPLQTANGAPQDNGLSIFNNLLERVDSFVSAIASGGAEFHEETAFTELNAIKNDICKCFHQRDRALLEAMILDVGDYAKAKRSGLISFDLFSMVARLKSAADVNVKVTGKLFPLIGPSGSGKSTTVNFLSGRSFSWETFEDIFEEFGIQTKIKADRLICLDKSLSDFVIGDSAFSQTQVVRATYLDNLGGQVVDTPGLNDTRGAEVDYGNASMINNVLRLAKEVVPLIFIAFPDISGPRGGIRKLLDLLTNVTVPAPISENVESDRTHPIHCVIENAFFFFTHAKLKTVEDVNFALIQTIKAIVADESLTLKEREFKKRLVLKIHHVVSNENRCVILDPSTQDRDALISTLKKMSPLHDVTKVLRMSVSEDAQNKFLCAVAELERKVRQRLSSEQLETLFAPLKQLKDLSNIVAPMDLGYNALVKEIEERVLMSARVVEALINSEQIDVDQAKNLLMQLTSLHQAQHLGRIVPTVDQAVNQSVKVVEDKLSSLSVAIRNMIDEEADFSIDRGEKLKACVKRLSDLQNAVMGSPFRLENHMENLNVRVKEIAENASVLVEEVGDNILKILTLSHKSLLLAVVPFFEEIVRPVYTKIEAKLRSLLEIVSKTIEAQLSKVSPDRDLMTEKLIVIDDLCQFPKEIFDDGKGASGARKDLNKHAIDLIRARLTATYDLSTLEGRNSGKQAIDFIEIVQSAFGHSVKETTQSEYFDLATRVIQALVTDFLKDNNLQALKTLLESSDEKIKLQINRAVNEFVTSKIGALRGQLDRKEYGIIDNKGLAKLEEIIRWHSSVMADGSHNAWSAILQEMTSLVKSACERLAKMLHGQSKASSLDLDAVLFIPVKTPKDVEVFLNDWAVSREKVFNDLTAKLTSKSSDEIEELLSILELQVDLESRFIELKESSRSLGVLDEPTFQTQRKKLEQFHSTSYRYNKMLSKYQALFADTKNSFQVALANMDLVKAAEEYGAMSRFRNIPNASAHIDDATRKLHFIIDSTVDKVKALSSSIETLTGDALKSCDLRTLGNDIDLMKTVARDLKSFDVKAETAYMEVRTMLLAAIQKRSLDTANKSLGDIAQALCDLQFLGNTISSLYDVAMSGVRKILEELSKDDNKLYDLGSLLSRQYGAEGLALVEQQAEFSAIQTAMWNSRVAAHVPEDAAKAVDGDDVNQSSLLNAWNTFFVLYTDQVEKGLKNIGELQISASMQAEKAEKAFLEISKSETEKGGGFMSTMKSLVSNASEFLGLSSKKAKKQSESVASPPLSSASSSTPSLNDWNEAARSSVISMMASVFAFWTVSKSKYVNNDRKTLMKPHPTQVFSILRLLGVDQLEHGQLRNHLIQIGTGEGKSITLGVAAVLFALLGCDVDCVCYSEYLSNRDYENFKDIFKFFEVAEHIKYSTLDDACERMINADGDLRKLVETHMIGTKDMERRLGEGMTQSRRERVLLIDEVDVLFSKTFLGNTYNSSVVLHQPEMANLVKCVWNESHASVAEVQKTEQFSSALKLIPHFEDVLKLHVKLMLSHKKRFDEHRDTYIVKDKKIAYKHLDTFRFDRSYSYSTAFAWLEEIRKGKVDPEEAQNFLGLHLVCGRFSFAEVPKRYSCIMGVTGTLKALSNTQKELLRSEYNISKYTYMPSMFGQSRLTFREQDNVSVENNREDWKLKIFENVKKMQDLETPVIVVFKTAADVSEFAKGKGKGLQNVKELTPEVSINDRGHVIRNVATLKQITLITREFGRGTDFVCYDENVEKVGGVHVMQTFVAEDLSESVQIKGRTARQGKSGTFSLVLDKQLLEDDSGVSTTRYEEVFNQNGNVYKLIEDSRDHLHDERQKELLTHVKENLVQHEKSIRLQTELLKNSDRARVLLAEFLLDEAAGAGQGMGLFHIILNLDCSGSMDGDRWHSLQEAVREFYSTRSEFRDIYSINCYDSSCNTTCSAREVTSIENLNGALMFSGGGTDFAPPLITTQRLIGEGLNSHPDHAPVVIFMTDGECSSGDNEMTQLWRTYGEKGLQTFVVGFDINEASQERLKRLAACAEGVFLSSKDGIALKEHFVEISKSMSLSGRVK